MTRGLVSQSTRRGPLISWGPPNRLTFPRCLLTNRNSREARMRSSRNSHPRVTALVYSTYFGSGSTASMGLGGIAVDAAGAAYVTSDTPSSTFPTQSPYQASLGGGSDAFVTRARAGGRTALCSIPAYLGGHGTDQMPRSGGCRPVRPISPVRLARFRLSRQLHPHTGTDSPGGTAGYAFVAKSTPAGDALVYSTYLGCSGGEGT